MSRGDRTRVVALARCFLGVSVVVAFYWALFVLFMPRRSAIPLWWGLFMGVISLVFISPWQPLSEICSPERRTRFGISFPSLLLALVEFHVVFGAAAWLRGAGVQSPLGIHAGLVAVVLILLCLNWVLTRMFPAFRARPGARSRVGEDPTRDGLQMLAGIVTIIALAMGTGWPSVASSAERETSILRDVLMDSLRSMVLVLAVWGTGRAWDYLRDWWTARTRSGADPEGESSSTEVQS